MIRKTFRHLPLAALAALAIAGCGGTSGGNGSTDTTAELLFSPIGGAVPSPNDLAFSGSLDGTVNASQPPIAEDSGPLDSIESINSQDGFSTVASSTATFTVPVDPDTVVPGTTVRMFEVTVDPATKAVTGLVGELTPGAPGDPGAQFTASLSSADRNGRTLAVTPLAPLNDSPSPSDATMDAGYLVVVTDGIEEEGGGPIGASDEYDLVKGSDPLFDGSNSLVEGFSDDEAQTLEGVRQLTQTHLAVTSGVGISTDDLIATWSFSTQSIGDVLGATDGLLAGATITAPAFADTGADTSPAGAADIWVGRLSGIPYYLGAPTSDDPDKPLTAFWEAATEVAGERNLTGANPVPRERSTVDIPVVLAIPNGAFAGACPCPIVIFQHGITTNRKSALGIADSLAQAGLVTIGIDLPLHGITDTSDSLFAGDANAALSAVYGGNIERTFDLDLIDNETGAAGADGEIDSSGKHFINLASLRTSRDNLRQAVVDLLALESVLPTIEATVEGLGSADVDSGTIHFVGQSLGGIVGVPYLNQSGGAVSRAVLSAPGGGIAKLLDGSPSIGPQIAAGLGENGLTKGLSSYEQFLGVAQTLVDSADPINHAAGAAASGTGIVLFEVIGGNSSDPDQVVPNFVDPAYPGTSSDTIPSPTGGTDPLVAAMGLTQIGNNNEPGAGGTVVKFTAGEHSSIINPESDPNVITEMQTIAAAFLAAGGYTITDSTVVEDAP